MLQLTYVSTATRTIAPADIDAILASSRRNNAAAGVTGLLLYDGRRFLQALEGEAVLVNRTYERIKGDGRHRSVVMLSSNEVAVRAFGDWAMAAEHVRGGGGGTMPEQIDAMTAQLADASLRELFRGFARVRAAA